MKKYRWFLVLISFLIVSSALADFVLSGNIGEGQAWNPLPNTKGYPTSMQIEWVTTGPFATDNETLSTGAPSSKSNGVLFDGNISNLEGTKTYSKWRGGLYATLIMDFKRTYIFNSVYVWSVLDDRRQTEQFEVLISSDGREYTSYGVATNLIMTKYEGVTMNSRKLEPPVAGRFVKLRIKRRKGASQQQITEVAVSGEPLNTSKEGFLRAGEQPPVTFSIHGIGTGIAVLDLSGFNPTERKVKSFKVYRSNHPFEQIFDKGVKLVYDKDGTPSKINIFPLEPETVYYFGVTAVYKDGRERPEVHCMPYRTPPVLANRCFGDVLAVNHFWGGGGSRQHGRSNQQAWEQVAFDLLGQLHFKEIRWWLHSDGVIRKMIDIGMTEVCWPIPDAINHLNKYGMYFFSMGNEPDLSGRPVEWYIEHLKEGYKAAKAANPANKVSAPTCGLENESLKWLDEFLEKGGGDYLDVIDVHTYSKISGGYVVPEGYPAGAPEAILERVEALNKVLKKHGLEKLPKISTEFGYTDCNVGNPAGIITPEMKANYLVRGFVLHYISGFSRVFLYSFWDEGDDPNYTEHHFGIVDYYLQKKPAFRALQVMEEELGKGVYLEPVKGCENGIFGYTFKEDECFVNVIWDGRGAKSGVFRTEKSELELIDRDGNRRLVIPDANQQFQALISEKPLYIRSTGKIELLRTKLLKTLKEESRFYVNLPRKVILTDGTGTTAPVAVEINNPWEHVVDLKLIARNAEGQSVATLSVKAPPGTSVSHLLIPLDDTNNSILDRYELVAVYSTPYESCADRFYVDIRKLTPAKKTVTVKRSIRGGNSYPVYILSNSQIELCVDPHQGGRIIDFWDKKTKTNQLRMDYDFIEGLSSIQTAYGIWDAVGGALKKEPYHVKVAGDGMLVLEGETPKGLKVTRTIRLNDKARVDVTVKFLNSGNHPCLIDYVWHPEYQVGGLGESNVDIFLFEIAGKQIVSIPFWNGLGNREHADMQGGWCAILDEKMNMALLQEYDPDFFGQPRLWFGEQFYNIELRSRKITLNPGESRSGHMSLELLHKVDRKILTEYLK